MIISSKSSIKIVLSILILLLLLIYYPVNAEEYHIKTLEDLKNIQGGAKIKIQFGSPGMAVLPNVISYYYTGNSINWEKCYICIYCPANYHILTAKAKLLIPDDIEFKVNIDKDSQFFFEPESNTYSISNIGYYNETVDCDWFEIRPKIGSKNNNYEIEVNYSILYLVEDRSAKSYAAIHPDNIAIDNAFNLYQSDKIKIWIENDEKSLFSMIQENTWVIIAISGICSLILVIFGPGGEQRIKKIFKK